MSSDNSFSLKKPCLKTVIANKYEKTTDDTQRWWQNTFQNLEETSKTPFYKRRNHLEKCFSKEMLNTLINAGIEVLPDMKEPENFKPKPLIDPPSESKLMPIHSLRRLPVPQKFCNPYMNFMRKTEEAAQIWRPHPMPTLETVHLIEKAELLEKKIATEFNEWFSQVGSKSKSEIDENVILSIFEICISYPVVTSLFRRINEVGSVPEVTANYLGFPEKSESACVRKQIKRDIRAGKLKPQSVAFNKTLPVELRRKPFTENLKAKWFEYQIHHQDLETMAAIWRGITELHTTRVFINWLLNHPEISPPPFLKSEGLMNKKQQNLSTTDMFDVDENELELMQILKHRKSI